MPWMVSIERVRDLGKCCAAVVAACYEEVVGCGVGMVGDADLVGAVRCDPFPVVDRNSCSCGIEGERGASVVAGADVYVCERRGCGGGGPQNVFMGGWCSRRGPPQSRGFPRWRRSTPSRCEALQ